MTRPCGKRVGRFFGAVRCGLGQSHLGHCRPLCPSPELRERQRRLQGGES